MRIVAALALVLLLPAHAAEQPVLGGYQEAVFSVSDAVAWRRFFEDVAGWELLYDGDTDNRLLRGWQLPDGAGARELVLGNPGTTRGYVRLVEFSGVPQRQIRSNAQTWDTGGWFDVNSRILDMATQFAELQARHWQAVSDPVEFAFGPFVVREWLARGPDGIVIALIERVRPALEGWPHLRKMSQFFNATQIVRDIDAARAFYIDTLGFEIYLEHNGASQEAGMNVLGLPHNLATEVSRSITIVHPDGTNLGSVELLQFDGVTGRDFSALAVPPNLGVLMLRFPVSDVDAFATHMASRSVDIAMSPTEAALPPYGTVRIMAVRGPGGVWIEFFEPAADDD